MSFLDTVLDRLGLRRIERRRYTLDSSLSSYLDVLAKNEQRPAEEVAVELIASGAVQHDLAIDSYQRWQALSPREQQVAALSCLGYTSRQIATKLMISPETVKSHIKKVLVKFDLHSRDELRMLMADWNFSAWE
jgi:DNA-binding CsgD family transcriptional regulator